jgi:hypothetical protein
LGGGVQGAVGKSRRDHHATGGQARSVQTRVPPG